MLKHLPIRTREQALEYGQKFVDQGLIECVNQKKPILKDSDSYLYSFIVSFYLGRGLFVVFF